jgi:hypothetical protein
MWMKMKDVDPLWAVVVAIALLFVVLVVYDWSVFHG